MLFVGLVVTGVSLFVIGAGIAVSCCPPSEKEQVEKVYEELELQRKKEKLMPMRNADINLFGALRY